jgi:N-methylhydantoinase A
VIVGSTTTDGAASAGGLRLGIDIGGTFTDLTVLDAGGATQLSFKTPTVPGDPAAGVANALARLADHQLAPERIDYFVHGTTIALNSVIQRSGARTAMIVTEGFRDLLELGRLRLPSPFSFYSRRPTPLIGREAVVTAHERLRCDGSVEQPLSDAEVERVVDAVMALGVEGVAICLLHAYVNPAHEERLAAALARRAPELSVSRSAEIWPEIREYERALVTVLNAYVGPPMERYVDRLHAILGDAGVGCAPYLTRSNGGVMRTDTARKEAVQTLLSGPAAGVIGATDLARRAGLQNAITFDMGGTSADISIVVGGAVGYSRDEHIGDFPVVVPAVAISSIGAGGGSIATVDSAGVLKVGPESAGADPGPACYGLGGSRPTVTDAFLLSGYLNAEGFAGKSTLDAEAARAATAALGDRLGRSVPETASAVIDVALANMYTDFSATIERRGIDPRDFTLVAFGGAGPVVACLLAEEVNIARVLFPPAPGTLCALGALKADIMADFVRTANWSAADLDEAVLRAALAGLSERATAWLDQEAPAEAEVGVRLTADVRYVGQSYELDVPIPAPTGGVGAPAGGAPAPAGDVGALEAAFHAQHERVFGHADRGAPTELVNLRARAAATLPRPAAPAPEVEPRGAPPALLRREIRVRGVAEEAVVYAREALEPGHRLAGPALVWQDDTTVVLPSGWSAAVDGHGNALTERDR